MLVIIISWLRFRSIYYRLQCEFKRLSSELKDDEISEMDFLRQLTFENVKWTKNFDSFDTVDDFLDEDDDEYMDTNVATTSEPMKKKKEKLNNKQKVTSIPKKVSQEKVPTVLIKRLT